MRSKVRTRNRTHGGRHHATADAPPAPVKLATGKLANGQFFPKQPEVKPMNTVQRRLNTAFNNVVVGNVARDGSPKKLTEAKPAYGQKSREDTGHPLAFDGAKRPLDDEPLQKNWDGKGNVPTNPGMFTKSTERGTHDRDLGNRVLQDAMAMGKAGKA
jgi:hypothetical protein